MRYQRKKTKEAGMVACIGCSCKMLSVWHTECGWVWVTVSKTGLRKYRELDISLFIWETYLVLTCCTRTSGRLYRMIEL